MASYEISSREREDEERMDAYDFSAELFNRENEEAERYRLQEGPADEE